MILPKLSIILMTSTDTGCRYIEQLKQLNFAHLSLVVTNPDRPRGRGRTKKLLKAKVAEFCEQKKICIFQPENINSSDAVKVLKEISAALIIVVDFGQILSKEVLNIPHLSSFNVHYSLLPDLRGPEPVRWALLKGYSKTGVTLMKMNEEIDKGEIVFKKEVPIADEDNYETLKEKLTDEGVKLLKKFLENVSEGKNINYTPQVNLSSFNYTYASKIDKKVCRIDWALPAVEIVKRIRAMSPAPGCWTSFKNSKIRVKIIQATDIIGNFTTHGRVVEVTKKSFIISAAGGAVEILKIQKEGKKIMDSAQFLAGTPVKEGEILI